MIQLFSEVSSHIMKMVVIMVMIAIIMEIMIG